MSEANETIFPGRRKAKKPGIQTLLEISDANDVPPKRRERKKKNDEPPKRRVIRERMIGPKRYRERGKFLTMVRVNDEQMEAIMSGESVTINGMNDGENHVLLGLYRKLDQSRFYRNVQKGLSTTFTPDMYSPNMFVVSRQYGSGFLDTVRGLARNSGVQRTIGNLAGQAVSRVAGNTAGNIASSVIRSGLSSFGNNESARDAALRAGISGARAGLDSYSSGAGYSLGGDVSNPMQPWANARERMAYVRAFKKGGSFRPL